MSLSAGSRLGPYEILAPLGAGGMGAVYKARDTRLDRTVAIKVLPEHVAANPEARQRFEREARAVSALNHPYICTLHDIGRQDGVDFLVLEYLEGETLASRLERGPLALDQALHVAGQIADALDKAHRKGLTHRDLKPGNIMLTKAGAKLLDFGLAKLRETPSGAGGGAALSAMPTQAQELTQKGTILGTLQYMSPEQLEGKEVDARADIFAFGVVLYEMVTGHKAFTGKSPASLIAAILEHEPPPVSSLRPVAPALDHVVKKCLAKDPEERWQSAQDVAAELAWVTESTAAPAPLRHASHRRFVPWLAGAGAAVAAFVLAVVLFRAPARERTVRFLVSPPEKGAFETSDAPAISPDGETLLFNAVDSNGTQRLWIRPLNSVSARPIVGTEGAVRPFWSPDSRSVAFFADGRLKIVDPRGGPPQTLCDAPAGLFFASGAWGRHGVILFRAEGGGVLSRVAVEGGEVKPATSLDASRQELGHSWPHFLPDGRHFLYFVTSARPEHSGVYVAALDSLHDTADGS